MAQRTITGGGAFTYKNITDINANFTDLYAGGSGETLTNPLIKNGLTASGSVANDFSGSSGAFNTSTGAVALNGATTITAATPSLTTATGQTNTGFLEVLGKTSGGLKITTADATAEVLTLSAAAQTSGNATLSLPNLAGSNDTVATLAASQALTNKTLNGLTVTSSTGTLTIANGKTATVSNTLTLAGTDATTMTFPATSANIPGAVGASYKIARGVSALGGTNPTTIASGLTTVVAVAAVLNRSTSLATGSAFVTYNNFSSGSFDLYAWVVAGTASSGTENVSWVAIGT